MCVLRFLALTSRMVLPAPVASTSPRKRPTSAVIASREERNEIRVSSTTASAERRRPQSAHASSASLAASSRTHKASETSVTTNELDSERKLLQEEAGERRAVHSAEPPTPEQDHTPRVRPKSAGAKQRGWGQGPVSSDTSPRACYALSGTDIDDGTCRERKKIT
eukprot:654489-Rhodomonas_salina.1